MSDTKQVVYRDPGLCTLLTVLFVGLKLTDNIDWSWWWVLSPLWIPIAFILGVMLAILLVAGIVWGLVWIIELPLGRQKPKSPRNKYRGL